MKLRPTLAKWSISETAFQRSEHALAEAKIAIKKLEEAIEDDKQQLNEEGATHKEMYAVETALIEDGYFKVIDSIYFNGRLPDSRISPCVGLAVGGHLIRCPHCKKKIDCAAILGSVKSEKKAAAARENGKKGGRPPKKKDEEQETK